MHATVCLLCAGQPRRAGDVAKSGEFIGESSWVAYDPITIKELIACIYNNRWQKTWPEYALHSVRINQVALCVIQWTEVPDHER